MDHALFQPRGHRDDLKNRPGLVGIVDAAVPPHLVSGILDLLLRQPRGIHFPEIKGMVKIKLRHIDTGVNLPIPGIHQENRNLFRLFLLHDFQGRLLRVLLDIPVQADDEILPRNSLLPRLTGIRELHAPGVGEGQNLSVGSF